MPPESAWLMQWLQNMSNCLAMSGKHFIEIYKEERRKNLQSGKKLNLFAETVGHGICISNVNTEHCIELKLLAKLKFTDRLTDHQTWNNIAVVRWPKEHKKPPYL